MIRSSIALALLLFAGACGDEDSASLGFMEVCTSTPDDSCGGADDALCPNQDDCSEGLSCRASGTRMLCIPSCTTTADCAVWDDNAICEGGRCPLVCTTNLDCENYGMVCNGVSKRCM